MTEDLVARLREALDALPDREWEHDDIDPRRVNDPGTGDGLLYPDRISDAGRANWLQRMQYVALANPENVRLLLDDRDQWREKAERLQAILDTDWNEENDRLREVGRRAEQRAERYREALSNKQLHIHELMNHGQSFAGCVPCRAALAAEEAGESQ